MLFQLSFLFYFLFSSSGSVLLGQHIYIAKIIRLENSTIKKGKKRKQKQSDQFKKSARITSSGETRWLSVQIYSTKYFYYLLSGTITKVRFSCQYSAGSWYISLDQTPKDGDPRTLTLDYYQNCQNCSQKCQNYQNYQKCQNYQKYQKTAGTSNPMRRK